MIARVYSAALVGVEALLVRVEVDVAPGLPTFATVGLPDSTVRESRERVRTAVRNAGFKFPSDRITVNLAPAHFRKEGPGFDLPIALALLTAMGCVREGRAPSVAVVGELALDGEIRPVRGVLAVALACRKRGIRRLLVPAVNEAEARLIDGVTVLSASTLTEAVATLNGERLAWDGSAGTRDAVDDDRRQRWAESPAERDDPDMAEVRGQAHAKRAMEIAAAGAHNVILIGPPGAGKTMLARRLPGMLPPLTADEAVEVSTIWSVAGRLDPDAGLVRSRPFRAPHHSISMAGLIGGGPGPNPGEATFAHRGVLFLDEMPEFQSHVLESLRQPLEEGRVSVVRVSGTARFPARFQLIGAANPCRRGCQTLELCVCTPGERQRYLGRLSRPLLDRIDLHVELAALPPADVQGVRPEESSAEIRKRVAAARERQQLRFLGLPVGANSEMTTRHLRGFCRIPPEAEDLLTAAITRLGLSARGYDRVLKVARTIADLAGDDAIAVEHVAEAVQYRGLDRSWRP
jgi:magnesium chelatase family protein